MNGFKIIPFNVSVNKVAANYVLTDSQNTPAGPNSRPRFLWYSGKKSAVPILKTSDLYDFEVAVNVPANQMAAE